MKHYLLILAFFLLPNLTWAHGIKDPDMAGPPYCYVQPPGGEFWYACNSEEAKLIDCLKLMETAMKALDPFVPSLAEMNAHPILSDPEKGLRALKVWDRAKNQCWSDLKDLQPQHYH